MIKNIYLKSRRFSAFSAMFLLVPTIPVAIGNTNVLDQQTRNINLIVPTFLVISFITAAFLIKGYWKWYDIGLKPKKIFKGTGAAALFCILGLIFAGPYARLLGFTEVMTFSNQDFFEVIKWSFIFVAFQDLMYQSFLYKVGNEIFTGKNGWILNVLSVAVLFTAMHSIFDRPFYVMAFVAPGAAIFTFLYHKYRNIYIVIPVHMVYSIIAFHHIVFKY